MVTKKDFKAVAEIIADSYAICETPQSSKAHLIRYTARNLADYFATRNPRFDRQKFLDACGLQAGK